MRFRLVIFGTLAAAGCGGPAFDKEAVRTACDTVIRKYHQAILDGDLDALKQCLGAAQRAELEASDPAKADLALELMKETAPLSLEWGGIDYLWKSEHIKRAGIPDSIDTSRGFASATYRGPDADGNTVAYHLRLFPADPKGQDWRIFKISTQVKMKVED